MKRTAESETRHNGKINSYIILVTQHSCFDVFSIDVYWLSQWFDIQREAFLVEKKTN